MNLSFKKYDFWVPLIAMLLYFLAYRGYFPLLAYSFLIIPASFYFFPLKDLMFGENQALREKKIDLLSLFSNFILSVLLLISISTLYLRDNETIFWIIKILALINVFFMIFYYFKDKVNTRGLLHMCFAFFVASLLV